MKILLIAGGWSPEREVSLKGAQSIKKALEHLGHEVALFDLSEKFDELINEARLHDFAFINLHGAPGEDGLVQAILEQAQVPYQGSSAAGSFLALHKAAAKQIFQFNGLRTPAWEFLPTPPPADWRPAFSWPIFVKSNNGGSSLRLSKVNSQNELADALGEIFAAGDSAIVEPVINGRDLTCGVLGEKALPPVLIEPAEGSFFDYKSKYAQNGAREICPAPIEEHLAWEVQNLALKAHKALGLSNYSRADFILDAAGKLWLLEVNTLPGMTATSLVPKEASAIGLSFEELLEKLIQLGLSEPKQHLA